MGALNNKSADRAVWTSLLALILLIMASALPWRGAASAAYIAPAGPYTIGWISDTQRYSASYKETFPIMTQYLSGERDALNLGYVAMTGDLVNKGSSRSQWQTARSAMNLLEPVPYGVLAGNHDRDARGDYSSYKRYFGENHFVRKPYYGGSYKDNLAHYDMISLGETDYIFVYLSYQPDEEMMDWANAIFRAHPGRVGALCVHDYLDSKARLRAMGETLQREVVAKNPNIFLVLCGHRYTEACVPAYFDDDGNGKNDRTVYQCIANYQTMDRGGLGYIRFIEIDEGAGTLRFYTYSPLLDEYLHPRAYGKGDGEAWPLPWEP